MAGTMDILIREMTIADYDQVYGLWTEIKALESEVLTIHGRAWSAFLEESHYQCGGCPERSYYRKYPLRP